MIKPVEKAIQPPLVHHPSDALDAFCRYDAGHATWLEFDQHVSHQLIAFEFENRQYIRVRRDSRRSSAAA